MDLHASPNVPAGPQRRATQPTVNRFLTAGLLGVSIVLAAGCASSTKTTSGPTTTTTAPVGIIGSTPSSAQSTTTTTAVPPAPQTDASEAAGALINAWVDNDRATALRVATPAAVATLFAQPYQGQTVVNRQCTVTFPPYTCSYGQTGGGSPNTPLYQIVLSKAGSNWYVSSVQIDQG